jgi:hypothetical protein
VNALFSVNPGIHFTAEKRKIRATDAKEVGVENPAEETYCHPNQIKNLNVRLREGGALSTGSSVG